MTKNNKDGLPLLEYKIENMLDELIKSDEEIENNAIRSSLKFSEVSSSAEEDNVDDELFEKDFFSNPINQEQNQQNKWNNCPNKAIEPNLFQKNMINPVNYPMNQPINNQFTFKPQNTNFTASHGYSNANFSTNVNIQNNQPFKNNNAYYTGNYNQNKNAGYTSHG